MTETVSPVAVAREELARLSTAAKAELHNILGGAAAAAGVAREHLLALTGELHSVLSVEVAPLDHLARIKTLEDSLSDAVRAKAGLESSLANAQAAITAVNSDLAAARQRVSELEAEKADAAAVKEALAAAPAAVSPADPLAAPAPEAPQS